MPYLYLTITVLASAAVNLLSKTFHRKKGSNHDGTSFYTFLLITSALICWGCAYAFDFTFDPGVLVYSLAFSLFFVVGHVGIVGAMQCAPTTLTSLFVSLSLLIPTVWGFFFWNSPLSTPIVFGLVFVALSIYLCLYSKEKSGKTLSVRWLFFITLGIFGNAGCTIVQKQEQIDFDGQHGTMLMFFSMLFSTLLYLFVYLKSDHGEDAVMLKNVWWAPVLAGVSNTLLNLFVILLANTELSPSLIYPVIAVGKLAVVTIASLLVFKEKMRRQQWVGVGIGAIAIALLSL